MQVEFYCRFNPHKSYNAYSHNEPGGVTFRKLVCVVLVLLLLMSPAILKAQEKESYIFQDSSVMEPADDVIRQTDDTTTVVDNQAKNEGVEEMPVIPDSVLVSNELEIAADSVRVIKAAKQFAYAKHLDSMLKHLKKQQEVSYNVESSTPSKLDLFFSATPTKMVFWSIAVCMLLFILFKLFFSGGILQRNSSRSNVKVLATEEEQIPDVSEYTKLISKAISEKNYRLATRYLYLQSLHHLIDRGVVTYAADKTNHEYLSEMSGNPKREAFAALTLKYEYVWYGGFNIDDTAFAGIQQSFTQFNNAF